MADLFTTLERDAPEVYASSGMLNRKGYRWVCSSATLEEIVAIIPAARRWPRDQDPTELQLLGLPVRIDDSAVGISIETS